MGLIIPPHAIEQDGPVATYVRYGGLRLNMMSTLRKSRDQQQKAIAAITAAMVASTAITPATAIVAVTTNGGRSVDTSKVSHGWVWGYADLAARAAKEPPVWQFSFAIPVLNLGLLEKSGVVGEATAPTWNLPDEHTAQRQHDAIYAWLKTLFPGAVDEASAIWDGN
jgi:hypothetical protein